MSIIHQLAKEYGLEVQIVNSYDKLHTLSDSKPIILDTTSIDLEITDSENENYEHLCENHHVVEINTKLADIYQSQKATKTNLSFVQTMFELSKEDAHKRIKNGHRHLIGLLDPVKQYLADHQAIVNHRFSVDFDTLEILNKYEKYSLAMRSKITDLIDKSKDVLTTKPVKVSDLNVYYYYIWLRAVPSDYQLSEEIDRVSKLLVEFDNSMYQVIAKSLLTNTYDLDKIIKTNCRDDIWITYVRILKRSKKPYHGIIYGLVGAKLQYYTTQPRPVDTYCLYPLVVNAFATEHINTFAGKKLAMICSVYKSNTSVLPYLNKLTETDYESMLALEKELFD